MPAFQALETVQIGDEGDEVNGRALAPLRGELHAAVGEQQRWLWTSRQRDDLVASLVEPLPQRLLTFLEKSPTIKVRDQTPLAQRRWPKPSRRDGPAPCSPAPPPRAL